MLHISLKDDYSNFESVQIMSIHSSMLFSVFLHILTLRCLVKANETKQKTQSICSLSSKMAFVPFYQFNTLFSESTYYSFDKIIFWVASQVAGFLFRLASTSLCEDCSVTCSTSCILELFSGLNYMRHKERDEEEHCEYWIFLFLGKSERWKEFECFGKERGKGANKR